MGLLEGLNELINCVSLGTCCSPALLQGWDRIPGGDCELGPSLGRGWPLDSGLFICDSVRPCLREGWQAAP